MATELSQRQQRIIEFIESFIEENHYPPTIREIGKKVGISSTSVVKYNLDVLERKGLLSRKDDISRGIQLVATATARQVPDFFRIPVVGRIAAGEPLHLPDTTTSPFGFDRNIEITRDLVKNAQNVYALEVKGESMIDALINDGDIVVMQQAERVENGELAAVWLTDRNETTLKRFFLEGDRVRLQPENPTMKAMYFPAADVQVMGKVLLVVRQLN